MNHATPETLAPRAPPLPMMPTGAVYAGDGAIETERGTVMSGKGDRVLSRDGLALRYALDCGIDTLRVAALAHIRHAIETEHGASTKIAARIGVSNSTYQRWLESIPDIASAHYANRPEKVRGPVPRALEEHQKAKKKRGRKAKG
jgi:hypothetical protein